MTVKTKSEEKEFLKKKKGGFLSKFILITILFVLGVALLARQKPELFEEAKQIALGNKDAASEGRAEPDNSLVTDALNEGYSVGAEPPLTSFAPEEQDVEEQEIKEFAEENPEPKLTPMPKDPYIKIIEKEGATESVIRENVAKELDEYRLYLANANKLISNFRDSNPYDAELKKLKSHKFPAHIKKIVALLDEYKPYLLEENPIEPIEIKPFDSALLSKFIKIKKIPLQNEQQRALKQDIEMRLKIFTEYLYSDDLQNSFVNR